MRSTTDTKQLLDPTHEAKDALAFEDDPEYWDFLDEAEAAEWRAEDPN